MKPGGDLAVGGLPFRMCVWFVKNPGRVLFTQDIAQILKVPSRYHSTRTATARKHGWIKVAWTEDRELYYMPGELLEKT